MKEYIEKLVLQTVNNGSSVMPLFKTGYAYSQVFGWCAELQEKGYLGWSDDDVRVLTPLGIERLKELSKVPEKTHFLIKPLAQYKIEKKSIEDIYLP